MQGTERDNINSNFGEKSLLIQGMEWLWLIARVYVVSIVVISVFLPRVFRTDNWRQAVWIVLKQGKPLPILGILFLSVYALVTRTLCSLDYVLFPGLKQVEREFFERPGKLVFVLGHPRSGTTNIQNAISSLDNCFTGTITDVVCNSLIQKYMLQPFGNAINFLLQNLLNLNQKNHKITQKEPLEEQLFLFYTFHHELFGFMFPILVENRKFCEEANAFDDWQMEQIKACLARVIYFRRTWGKE